jgi:hypothetical protein
MTVSDRLTSRNDDSIVLRLDLLGIDIDADVSTSDEDDTFRSHEVSATLNDLFVELHIRDTIKALAGA